jgi:CelD/BcsL family acetyltransferase involved in cellulose biosynthesis
VNVLAESEPAAAFAREPGFVPLLIRASGCCSTPAIPEERWPKWLSKNFRQKLRKTGKRLEAEGGAAFETVAAPGDVETAYEEFLQVETAGWKGEQGTRSALRLDERLGAFYRQVLRRFAARGRCEINLLRLGDRPIAGQCVLAIGDTAYVLKIGYDQAFSHLSPGVALMAHLIRRKGDSNAGETINFTTDMPWMKDWQPVSQDVIDVFLFRPTLRGRIAWWYWRVVQAVRFHRRKWAAPLYRRLLGTSAQRYRRKRQRSSPHAPLQ